LYSFKSERVGERIPFESENMIFLAHAFRSSFPIAKAAAHAHDIMIFWSSIFSFLSFNALIIPANTTIAVQC
jgi:hypothetical protein